MTKEEQTIIKKMYEWQKKQNKRISRCEAISFVLMFVMVINLAIRIGMWIK